MEHSTNLKNYSSFDRAPKVLELAGKYGNRLSDKHPYLEAEVLYACREEYAVTAVDVIARRMRLAFLDSKSSRACLPHVIDLMADELGWDEVRKQQETQYALKFLATMYKETQLADE